ncbi:hypothetical protein O181_014101 [Austropuccinia psidii MF-1]|uniref:DDE Tnp4 domain-containing protein n=1 Tax=Austropuccinia psidii MF-1 TaxID=1389203 RepID=A0A9Q3GNV0_9BASI|nr:hypothetical protein [Austropuccinia psidii MF-1]
MPRTSQRHQDLKDLELMWMISKIDENHQRIAKYLGLTTLPTLGSEMYPQDQDQSTLINQYVCQSNMYRQARYLLLSSLYLERPLENPKHPHYNLHLLFEMCNKDFKQGMRTSKEGFEFIYHKICNHEVFQNNSTCEQLPIAHQLALTFERLGSNGNAASVGKFARNFQVGRGTVILVTRWVINAIDSLEHDYIKWPNTQQRRQISQVMQQEGFDGCVGFSDGTNFPLYGKPAWQGEVYFDWKNNYLINAQILCDCDKKIIAFITGWPCSCADAMFGMILIQKDINCNKAICSHGSLTLRAVVMKCMALLINAQPPSMSSMHSSPQPPSRFPAD